MNNQISRIELLKGVKSAVNTASFAPTEGRIKEAKEAVAALMSYVESLEAPSKRKASKKRKQKAGKATPSTKVADRQEKAFHGRPDTPVTPSKRKPKASVEAARKSAHDVSRHTGAAKRAEKKAKKAVVMPKASPMEVTSSAAKRKAEKVKEAVRTACQERADMASQPSVSDARLADLEAKIEALIALQSMGHDVMRNENEVLFSDLPFDPTTNL